MEIKTAAQKQIDVVKRAEGCEFTHADQALLNRAEEIDRRADSRITVLHNRLVNAEETINSLNEQYKDVYKRLEAMAAQIDLLRQANNVVSDTVAEHSNHFDVIDDYLAQGMEAASSYVPESEPLNPDVYITLPRSLMMRIIVAMDQEGNNRYITAEDNEWINEFVASEMRVDQWTKMCGLCKNGAYTDHKGAIVECAWCQGRGKVRRHNTDPEPDPKPTKSWCGECAYCDMGNYAKCIERPQSITLDKYGKSVEIKYEGRTVTNVTNVPSTARCVNCDHHEEDHEEDGCVINMSDGPTPCGCPIFSGVADPEPEIMTAMDDPMRNERCFTCGHLRYEHMGVDGSGPCDDGWFESPDRCQCRKFVPEPTPDPVCANCKGSGIEPSGSRWGDAVEMVGCHCCEGTGTLPTAEPEPLDPVLMAIRDLYVLGCEPIAKNCCHSHDIWSELRIYWRKRQGKSFKSSAECDAAIRAYGRDGAR